MCELGGHLVQSSFFSGADWGTERRSGSGEPCSAHAHALLCPPLPQLGFPWAPSLGLPEAGVEGISGGAWSHLSSPPPGAQGVCALEGAPISFHCPLAAYMLGFPLVGKKALHLSPSCPQNIVTLTFSSILVVSGDHILTPASHGACLLPPTFLPTSSWLNWVPLLCPAQIPCPLQRPLMPSEQLRPKVALPSCPPSLCPCAKALVTFPCHPRAWLLPSHSGTPCRKQAPAAFLQPHPCLCQQEDSRGLLRACGPVQGQRAGI